MDQQIIKQLLSIEFYEDNKDRLSAKLFSDEILELYDIIVESHRKHGCDLSPNELLDLWNDKNPVTTTANKLAMQGLIHKIDSLELYEPSIAAQLIEGLWKRDTGLRIANIGVSMSEGKEGQIERLKALLERVEAGFTPTDFPEESTKDLDKLLAELSDENRFRFNIPGLAKHVYGIGRKEFGYIFARPNTGKTALGISLGCAPGGYADQGLKVVYLTNEEQAERTTLRAYSSWTGMTKPEIMDNPSKARTLFEQIEDRVTFMECMNWPLSEVEAFLKYKEADVGFVDQLDKIEIAGNSEGHVRLRDLYTQSREIPKRLNMALWGMSQASDIAENKTILLPNMTEGSKTGKYAEADLALGVGKYADSEDGDDNFLRFITVGKNKVNGWHGTISCKIERMLARYVD